MNKFRKITMLAFGVLAVLSLQGCNSVIDDTIAPSVAAGSGASATTAQDDVRSLSAYFTSARPGAKAVDDEGFIQRWLLLEPIKNDLRSNAGFTESFVRGEFAKEYFPDQLTVFPKNGDTVTVAGEELKWHALDAVKFNVKLFRFAYGLNKPEYGVTFWAVTAVEAPEDMLVRMSVGSNSASLWWLNSQEAVGLFGDRRMVADDCMSKRILLKKGVNIVRGAVINGPGMSDFCVRFVDENGKPVKGLKVNLDAVTK